MIYIPKRKNTKNSGKQKALAFIFAIVMVLGFAVIWATAEYYESSNERELLFVSDSNTEFINSTISSDYTYYESTYIETHARTFKSGLVNHTSLTPAYLGNNTWGMTCPEYNDIPYVSVDYYVQMDLPNLDSWIVTDFVYNFSLDETADYDGGYTFLHFDSPFPATIYGSASTPTAETHIATYYDFSGVDEHNVSVSLEKALKIYDNSQGKEYTSLEIGFVADDPTTALDGFAYTFSVKIYGYKQTTTTLETVLTWGLAGTTILNVVVIIFMTDTYDIGGFVRDIPKRRRR